MNDKSYEFMAISQMSDFGLIMHDTSYCMQSISKQNCRAKRTMRLSAHYMLDNKSCKGISMYYLIKKGGRGKIGQKMAKENGNFGFHLVQVVTKEREVQKTPNLHYVIHRWSLTNMNETR